MSVSSDSILHNLLRREVGLFSGKEQGFFHRVVEDKAAIFSTENTPCYLGCHPRATFLMSFSPDGTLMASSHGDHNIHITDVRTGEHVQSLMGHPRTPWCVSFHPTSNEILASGCLGGEVRIWDLHGGSESWTSDDETVIASLAFHPTDQVLAIATDNRIYLWDWSQPAPFTYVKTALSKEKVRLVKFDPTGLNILTGISNITTGDSDDDLDLSLPREANERDVSEFPQNTEDAHLVRRLRLQLTRQSDPTDDPHTVADALFNHPSNIDADQQAAASVSNVRPLASLRRHTHGPFAYNPMRNLDSVLSGTSDTIGQSDSRSFSDSISNQPVRRHYSSASNSSHAIGHSHYSSGMASTGNVSVDRAENISGLVRTENITSEHVGVSGSRTRTENGSHNIRVPADFGQSITVTASMGPSSSDASQENESSEDAPSSQTENSNAEPLQSNLQVGNNSSAPTSGLQLNIPVINIEVSATSGREGEAQSTSSTASTSNREYSSTPRGSPNSPRLNISIVVSRNRAGTTTTTTRTSSNSEVAASSSGSAESTTRESSSPLHFAGPEMPSGARTFAVRPNRRAVTRSSRLILNQQRRAMSDEASMLTSPLGSESRRARMTRFGFHRGTERSRLLHHHHHYHHHLHQHYSISIFDDTNRPSHALHSAINRAIAGAFAGSGETAVASNIVNTTHRLQWWDFTSYKLPDISDADNNVIVENCKIHNDASCDISQDGTMIAAFVPSHRGFPDDGILAIYSLQADSFGDCLYTKSFGPNAISASISPTNRYVMVGLASRRLHWHVTSKQMVAQIFRLKHAYAGEDSCQHIQNVMHPCDVERRMHVSVNSAKWLPWPGWGVVYGTNRGDLHICRLRMPVIPEDQPTHNDGASNSTRSASQQTRVPDNMYARRNIDTAGRVRDYQMLGVVGLGLVSPPETNSTATQTVPVRVQSTSTQTEHAVGHSGDNTSNVQASTSSHSDTGETIQNRTSDDGQNDYQSNSSSDEDGDTSGHGSGDTSSDVWDSTNNDNQNADVESDDDL
ncbi:activating molecule in BECN1-regulated autophagy protein 1-like [Saccoglossus kowalevskii]|uniref:Activating molecule in BECN1-regulated autophagy protein 1-like n=1 Tax=Saccoglossus kowalevskii TaxID=10224 RepID=A0ABM0M9X1_SACKO|nr:PREDICTED: activating molecule in BECN1-regulated autophagy protein 1-like [Saccoglossus kowalevskii]